MRSGVQFGDVLDDKVGQFQQATRSRQAAPDCRQYRPVSDPILLFFDLRFRPSPPPPSSPRRVLTPRQDRAFHALVELGATLPTDFTDADLRSAYRLLALKYHPDRHPGSSRAEAERLALLFTQLTDAYRQLSLAPAA
jgi:hypothetical protein